MHLVHQRQTSAATAARHARNLPALRGNSRPDADARAIAERLFIDFRGLRAIAAEIFSRENAVRTRRRRAQGSPCVKGVVGQTVRRLHRLDDVVAIVVLAAARVGHRERPQIVRTLRDIAAAAPFRSWMQIQACEKKGGCEKQAILGPPTEPQLITANYLWEIFEK